ncbi:MAG TPA: M1 family aminopeptidase [Blastocatellia bacterium]|nr:M1 family aminopeptidase [Blastocatellia bacterium]HMZ17685.1 M1 family aminopeptidase [Blastocatellia bacterium]HNG32689.1 M1 family aminopeptidase [Blastocatellia bacterium]
MPNSRLSTFFLLLLAAAQLGLTMTTNAQSNNVLTAEGVSRELARHRAARISDVRYRLDLELTPGAARFTGREEIRLKLADTTAPVILDFRDLDAAGKVIEGAASKFAVNSHPINDAEQTGGHIVFPARHFKAGENIITLEFESGVATAGRPVIRYNDRDDGSEYIYTLFVPMDAGLAFPCFDQPDLKARFTLSVTAPDAWQVIANTDANTNTNAEVVRVRPGFQQRSFAETLPISTYLFAFAAGPFKQLRDADNPNGIRLFVRQSKLKRAEEEWPEVSRLTREGIKHFVDFFGHRFPFPKYDQVLLPGFAYGGMEHAGATFLREDSILFRTTPTQTDKLGRASLVLHELAHQWFGDLVTMRWFDDLWLKEGFANLMAYHAMAAIYGQNRAREEAAIWKRFYQTHKPVAYGIDSTKGTTPIYQEVRNLKDAKSAYGAIVYQKAPSLLRALSFVIGEEKFREGVRLFLKEHAYANAEWNDLIGACERSSGQKLGTWADAWIKRRGMPQIDVAMNCNAQGNIERLELRQRDVLDEGGVWPIKTQLLLAYDDAAPVRIAAALESPRTTIAEAAGQKCPAYVFANDGDFGYGRFLLDARSREAVTARIGNIADPFLKTMLWGALWDAVREAELNPRDYVALVLKTLPAESDEELTGTLLDRAARSFQRYLTDAQQAALVPQLEQLFFDRMMKADALGLRITYFRAFRRIATTAAARNQLKEILAGKLSVPGVEIKPLDRWQIITALMANNDAEAAALLEAERKRDTGDDARKQAYIAEAARADAETKRRYFDDYLKNKAVAEDWIEGSLGAFNSANQSALTLPYLKPALEALPQVKRERKIFFVLAWLNAFIGGQQEQKALNQVREFLRANKLDRDLELKVLEVTDELARTVRIRLAAQNR